MNEWDEPPTSRGPGSLVHRGEGEPSTCLKCNWTGVPVVVRGVEDHRCPSCEIGVATDQEWRLSLEVAALPTVGRNDPCPCGSGKKYKKCHGR